ncbi:ATPase component of various ABC-type transport system [Rubellimicrobium thermophilum DSM 16684]|uniref:ATPase component of various ABC-type transport system n=1 Tax=Rubellimicrobium thermophilum DSM 16684 TaxID=1123069 RepID=S9RZ47_9RHOB|nr:ABC transporter ATP-binding protein [Rubellimicrobium thermophilum]EPX83295.1 ATPase component of various ABC-type transport system [Rubellimicrobium thermophilum DSM 16684]
MAPLLDIRDLTIEGRSGDDWMPLVRGVSLTLNRGEVLGLIGESGAGKSTLGLAAMGYVRDGCRIAGGSILFDGIDLVRAPEDQRRRLRGRRIAYVAQSAAASFNPAHRLIDQTVEAPVVHGVMPRAQAGREAVALYRRMQLPDPDGIGLRYPHQVSGGQLQRAMTAMAMASRPDLIIFDEPTTALDVTTQIEVLSAIRDIVRDSGTAAIYITHDLAVVAQMADRIKVLLRGQEVEEADTRSMLSAPREAYTKSLWAVRSHQRPERPPPVGEPVLAVRHVSAAYGMMQVLHGINLDLHVGRTTAVVGESGSGKSTLARVIAGLLPPARGELRLAGRRLAPSYRMRPREDLRAVQMIYQSADTALNPKMRLREIIGRPVQFHAGLSGAALERRLHELMEMIELDPATFLDRLPSELSGGQRQRVGIARALAAEPRVLLCDEVTSALDQIVAEGILKLLDRLQEELGLAILFITHDIATVRAIADDVVVMKDGRIVTQGTKADVLAPPHDPYTELLLSSVPEMDPDWLTRVLERRAAPSARAAGR